MFLIRKFHKEGIFWAFKNVFNKEFHTKCIFELLKMLLTRKFRSESIFELLKMFLTRNSVKKFSVFVFLSCFVPRTFPENSKATGYSRIFNPQFFLKISVLLKWLKLLRTHLIPGTSQDLGLDDPVWNRRERDLKQRCCWRVLPWKYFNYWVEFHHFCARFGSS